MGTTMQPSKARAIGSGVLAIIALTATVCVLDGNMIKEEKHFGNNQLEEQAAALDAQRDAMSAGMNVASVFDSLHKSSVPAEDKDLTAELEAAAPQKDDLDVVLSPNKLGLIKYHDGKAYLANPPEDDSDNEELIQLPTIQKKTAVKKSEETTLIQTSDGDWNPTGQEDLDTSISAAYDADEDEQIKADGLKGTSMLSAAGIDDRADEEASETFFVQESTAWTPSGQAGMTEQIESAEESDEQAKIKADGLKGQSVLSAAAIDEDEDEELIQEWTPVGQKIIGQTYEDDEEEKKDTDPWNTPDDGLDGNDILSAVGMENHKKTASDEEGLISAEDLGLDDILDN